MRRRAPQDIGGTMRPAQPPCQTTIRVCTRAAPSRGCSLLPLLSLLALLSLALLCAPCSVLRAHAQAVGASLGSPGASSQTLVVFGDAGRQNVRMDLFALPPFYDIFLTGITPTDATSFAKLDPDTVPTLSFDKYVLNIEVNADQAVAGNYTQQFIIRGQSSEFSASVEEVVLTLHITVKAALSFSTNATDSSSGAVSGAPSTLPEGWDFAQGFKLRSRPAGEVNVTVRANAEHGDIAGFGPRGQPFRGGGPLVTLHLDASSAAAAGAVDTNSNTSSYAISEAVLSFTPGNWNSAQHVLVRSVLDPRMQGDRWTLLEYSITAPLDPEYSALLQAVPPRNLTILEGNTAALIVAAVPGASGSVVVVSEDLVDLTAVPGSTPDQLLSYTLGSRPLSTVTVALPSAGRYSLTPGTLTFAPGGWNIPQVVRVSFYNSTSLVGRTVLVQNFSGAVSSDADYADLAPRAIRLQVVDSNDVLASISPPFAFYIQSPAAPTYLTLSFDAPRSFIPTAAGEKVLPSVSCVFGNTDQCASIDTFYGPRNVGCENPYAQILVVGTIVSPGQMACPIPGCPSLRRSSASAGGVASATVQECDGSYAVVPLINGHPAENALPFVYLMPVTAAERQQPQILSILPDVVDVNAYTWITVRGSYFESLTRYPNPTGKDAGVVVGNVLASCRIAGIVAPAVDVSQSETDPVTGQSKPIIRCLSRPRPDLAGSTDKVPVVVEVSLNGQEYTSNGLTISMFDYDKQTTNTAWTYFFVAVALVGMLFAAMILQHFLCANFFRTHAEEEEATKIRVTRGPQMLIDLLEPVVAQQTQAVREADKVEAAARTEAAQDDVKKRIAQIQREAAAKKEEKRRAKIERKAAKEAARIADAARQEVLAAAGLAPEIEMVEADGGLSERDERRRRKREKREREEAAAVAAAALSSGGESGVESDGGLALASPSGGAFLGAAAEAKDLADYDNDATIAPLTAAALGLDPPHTGRSGYSSEGSRTSQKSSQKSKDKKKHKKSKEHRHHREDAPTDDEIEMGEMKQHYVYSAQHGRPDAAELALDLGAVTGAAAAASALASPSAPLDSHDHALSPLVHIAPSDEESGGEALGHTEREKKRSKKNKKDKEKDKDKEKSGKKKKHKDKESGGGISGRQHQAMAAAAAASSEPALASARGSVHGSDIDSDAGDDAAGAPSSSRKKHNKDKSKKDKKSSKKKKKKESD